MFGKLVFSGKAIDNLSDATANVSMVNGATLGICA
jgi:hypothetical protein